MFENIYWIFSFSSLQCPLLKQTSLLPRCGRLKTAFASKMSLSTEKVTFWIISGSTDSMFECNLFGCLGDLGSTGAPHLTTWKFFEHMQSLLPSPSFFAGADQGATSDDVGLQTSENRRLFHCYWCYRLIIGFIEWKWQKMVKWILMICVAMEMVEMVKELPIIWNTDDAVTTIPSKQRHPRMAQ